MEINRSIRDGITVLKLSGNLLGEKDSQAVIDTLSASIEQGQNKFVADLEDLKYINSTGLSVLISILTKSRNAGGNMCILNLPEQVSKLLHITKLESTFPQASSMNEAIEIAKTV